MQIGFETFYDAVLAIIKRGVLKIPQSLGPEWGAFISNSLNIYAESGQKTKPSISAG